MDGEGRAFRKTKKLSRYALEKMSEKKKVQEVRRGREGSDGARREGSDGARRKMRKMKENFDLFVQN